MKILNPIDLINFIKRIAPHKKKNGNAVLSISL